MASEAPCGHRYSPVFWQRHLSTYQDIACGEAHRHWNTWLYASDFWALFFATMLSKLIADPKTAHDNIQYK